MTAPSYSVADLGTLVVALGPKAERDVLLVDAMVLNRCVRTREADRRRTFIETSWGGEVYRIEVLFTTNILALLAG